MNNNSQICNRYRLDPLPIKLLAVPSYLSKFFRLLIFPFGVLYGWITTFRNHLYDIQSKKTIVFTPFIISVGNLSVGGTGKTPMVAYLAEGLLADYPLAILSRGYGRQTRGVRIANEQDTARTLGDEPYLFYRKFASKKSVTVAVGEERVAAVPEILYRAPNTQLILLDDAYQHRAIARDFNILLTSYQRPFYEDYVLPGGRLREARRGARRADAVVVTKCPDDLSEEEMQRVAGKVLGHASPDVSAYFTGLRYGTPQPVFGATKMTNQVVLFSGLADASLFDAYARKHFVVVDHITFADHHRYRDKDRYQLAAALEKAGPSASLLTTEKDMVKLADPAWQRVPIFYLPIQPYFLRHKHQFQDQLLRRIKTYHGD